MSAEVNKELFFAGTTSGEAQANASIICPQQVLGLKLLQAPILYYWWSLVLKDPGRVPIQSLMACRKSPQDGNGSIGFSPIR